MWKGFENEFCGYTVPCRLVNIISHKWRPKAKEYQERVKFDGAAHFSIQTDLTYSDID